MKKQLIAISLSVALVYLGAAPAMAFQSVKKTTVKASATTGGTRTATYDLAVANVSTPGTTNGTTNISWSDVTAGATRWKMSDQLLRLTNIAVTDANGGIQIYTDNTSAAGTPIDPKFQDPTPGSSINPDSNPAGLLLAPTDGSGISANTIPLAWSIKAEALDGPASADPKIGPADPNEGPTEGYNNRYQWLFMKDAQTPAIDRNGNLTTTDFNVDGNGDGDFNDPEDTFFENPDTAAFTPGETFATMVKAQGLHTGQADFEFAPNNDQDAYVYLQADFTTAPVGATYVGTIVVESYIE